MDFSDIASAKILGQLRTDLTNLTTRVKANEDKLAGLTETTVMAEITKQVNAEVERAEGVEAGLAEKIEALETKVGDNDSSALAGRIKAIEDDYLVEADKTEVKDYADGLNTAMDTRVKVLEAIDHDQLAADAAASAVATILDEAPESFDTLKEVADWIANNDHADDVAALVTDVANLKAIDHNAYKAADETTLASAKSYADGLAGNYATKAQGAKADTAIQSAEGDTYVSATAASNKITVATKVQAVSTASASAKGLAEAYDVKSYVDSQVSAKNVSAEGDTYVSASASGNKVTVAATAATQASLAKADSALQSSNITEGSANGTIAVKGSDVAVHGLKDAAYVTVSSLNTTAQGYATTAKTEAIADADGKLALKANSADVYTKTETYTKSEVDSIFAWEEF